MKTLSGTLRVLSCCLALAVADCSLSSNLAKMETEEDYVAYIKKWAPTEDAFLAVQRAASFAIDRKDYKTAAGIFEQYRPLFPDMQKRFDAIIEGLRMPTAELEVKHLPPAVNSVYNEIKPSLTVDGKRLYFASDDRADGKGGLDIYTSKFENGEWQPAQNLGDRINTSEHQTINSISFDGTMILLYGGFTGHLGDGDNYFYEKTDKGWSPIRHFPMPVNGKSWDSDAFLTADGKALLFTSDREGVIGKRVTRAELLNKGTTYHGSSAGNSDIWVTLKRGNYWLPPVNLGPKINTPYCERSAFLHPDGKTLYFSSDGHPGYGKLDVFKTIRLREDSWTEWSDPVNLGKDINTSDDDWGYKISTDGAYAFFSADGRPGGYGKNDIYQVTLPQGARPADSVAVIAGTVRDKDGKPLGADVIVQNLRTGEVEAQGRTDPETGRFELPIPRSDKNLGIFFEKEGYYPDSRVLDWERATADSGGADGGGGRDGRKREEGKGEEGNGDGKNGANADGKNGANADGKNGDGKNGANGDGKNGDGKNGANGDGKNGANGDGKDGRGDKRNATVWNFNFDDISLTSIDDMRSKRDKYGDLLAQRVNNIFFDFAKWDLKPESFFELERLIKFLQTNADIGIVIAAHTDDVGSNEYNQDLSNKRAKSVVDHLIAHGIPASRLVPQGYGESRPEVPNDSEENRARNRRVEFRIAEE